MALNANSHVVAQTLSFPLSLSDAPRLAFNRAQSTAPTVD